MPLIKDALKMKMLDATEGGTDKAAVLDKLASAIQDYVKQNALFMFSWVGIGPPPACPPDPMVTATGAFINLMVKFSSLKAAQPDQASAALNLMKADLMTSFATAQYNMSSQAGFSTSPGIFGSSPALATLMLMPSQTTDRAKAFDSLAGAIVTWITSQVPVAPCAGTHAAFTGTGMVTKVS